MPSDRVDANAPASIIAARFGGLVPFCNAFDPPKPTSTVWRWMQSGLIPAKHQADVLEAAKRARVKVKPADFLPQAAPADEAAAA